MNANPNSREPSSRDSEDTSSDLPMEDSCPLCGGDFRTDSSIVDSPRTCSSCGLILRAAEPEIPTPEPIEEIVEEEPDPIAELDRWLSGEPVQTSTNDNTNVSWLSRAQEHPATTAMIGMALVVAIIILAIPTIALLQQRDAFTVKQAELDNRYEQLLDEKGLQKQQLLDKVEVAERKRDKLEQRLLHTADDLRASWAKRLAAHSQRLREKDPQRSLLLATEAIHATLGKGGPLVPQARQVLRDALKDVDGRHLLGHKARVTSLAISPDGRLLASGSFDRTVRVWSLAEADPSASVVVLKGHQGCVSNVKFSPNNRWLASGSFDSTAQIWDLSKQEETSSPQVFRGHLGRIGALTISNDSRWLVTGSSGFTREENTARLWDLTSPQPSGTSVELRGHTGPIHVVAVSPDNRWILTAGEDGMARLWDISSGKPESTSFLLQGHDGAILSAVFSADAKFLVTGGQSTLSKSATLRLWKISDRPPFDSIVLPGHQSGIRTIATTPDSRRLISVGNDSQMRIWNLQACNPAVTSIVIHSKGEPGGSEQIITVAVSPDSRWLATGDAVGTTRLWDLSSLDRQKSISAPVVFKGHDCPISKITISPDNHWLVTATDDGAIHVRTLRLEELIDPALERVVREHDVLKLTSKPSPLPNLEDEYMSSIAPITLAETPK